MSSRNGKRSNTTQRGYGTSHQARRRRLEALVRTGTVPCARCGEPILPGESWDLGHSDDRTSYTGPEHAVCNREAGAAKAQRSRDDLRCSREW